MKKALLIRTREYPEIKISWQRNFLEIDAVSMAQYSEILYHVYKHVLTNQIYIKALFRLVDYLYNYYELDKQYFELLNFTATNLEQLYTEKIAGLTEKTTIINAKEELASYFDKATMIFQTAADKTEDDRYREFYAAMARKYSEKADNIRAVFTASYTAKLQSLYENAAQEYEVDFIRVLFQARADEYKAKHTEENSSSARFWSPAITGALEEKTPLLAEFESQEGLRHRKDTTIHVPT